MADCVTYKLYFKQIQVVLLWLDLFMEKCLRLIYCQSWVLLNIYGCLRNAGPERDLVFNYATLVTAPHLFIFKALITFPADLSNWSRKSSTLAHTVLCALTAQAKYCWRRRSIVSLPRSQSHYHHLLINTGVVQIQIFTSTRVVLCHSHAELSSTMHSLYRNKISIAAIWIW